MLIPMAETCILFICLGGGGGGGGGSPVPEIDGAAAISALALVASVVAILYNRVKG